METGENNLWNPINSNIALNSVINREIGNVVDKLNKLVPKTEPLSGIEDFSIFER